MVVMEGMEGRPDGMKSWKSLRAYSRPAATRSWNSSMVGTVPAPAETSFMSGMAERTISGTGRPFCDAKEE